MSTDESTPQISGSIIGPWDEAFWFEVPLQIQSKSNFRRYGKKSSKSSWQKYAEFENELARLALHALPASWETGTLQEKLGERPCVVAFILAHSTLDASNLPKSVLDACEEIVFCNDASVRYCASLGVRTRKLTGGVVAFARVPGHADLNTIVQAAGKLQEEMLKIVEPSWDVQEGSK